MRMEVPFATPDRDGCLVKSGDWVYVMGVNDVGIVDSCQETGRIISVLVYGRGFEMTRGPNVIKLPVDEKERIEKVMLLRLESEQ